jgi:uncharacterized protein (TIGR02145 family)
MKKIIYSILTLSLGLVLSSGSCTPDAIDPTTDVGVNINGVIWATRNVAAPGKFAATPESPGLLYQWNRNIGWSATGSPVSTPAGYTWNSSTPSGSGFVNDPCPEGWRVPTKADAEKLLPADAGWDSARKGHTFNASGNTIFIPAAGYRHESDGKLVFSGEQGFFWFFNSTTENAAARLGIYNDGAPSGIAEYMSKAHGYSIRCVKKP